MIKAWAVVTKRGKVHLSTVATSRSDAILLYMSDMEGTWKEAKRD
jgi:hypothetical protein